MPEPAHHISSAVVMTRPGDMQALAASLALIEGVEVHAAAAGKVVIVIEGPHAGALGDTLVRISAMDGVLAAHMVFEQALAQEDPSDDERTHAA